MLLAVSAVASIGTACGETALPPSGGSSGSHSATTPTKDSAKAKDAAHVNHNVSKRTKEASSPSTVALDEMSVFSQPRTEDDVLPSSLSYLLEERRCDDWFRSNGGCLGEGIPEESRLLLTYSGVNSTSLYAWPTTGGWVCFAPEGGGSSCIHDFRPGGRGTRTAYMGIDPDTDGVGAPGALMGLVPDDVSAVTVKIGGVEQEQPAVIKDNGVFYELADGSCSFWAFESLTTTYRDGTSDTVPLHWHIGDEPMPETCEG